MKKLTIFVVFLLLTAILCGCATATTGNTVPTDAPTTPTATQPTEPKHHHNYESVVTEPSCEAGGYTTYLCECGDSYCSDEKNALGHSWTELSCTEPKLCTTCNIVGQPATGHLLENNKCVYCDRSGASEGLEFTIHTQSYAWYHVAGIGTCTDTDVIIPASYNGLPVHRIFTDAFKKNDNLISVTIPDSVEWIDDEAFYRCSNLTSVKLPQKLTLLRSGLFWRCEKLVSVELPDELVQINKWAFYGCENLTTITIPASVNYIGKEAFANCTSLTTLVFEGTMAQWYNLYKGHRWNANMLATEVICSNGVIPVNPTLPLPSPTN